jgi:Zn-dependent protease with chaperone function
MKPAILILLLLTYISLQAGAAQEPSAAAAQATASHAAPVPITEYTLPPDKLAKAQALYTSRVRMLIAGTLWNFLLLAAILYSGLAARFRDWAEAASGRRFVQALIAVPLLWLTLSALQLPLSVWQHRESLQYGLSVQSWGSWFMDILKGQLVMLTVVVPVLWLLLALIRRSPRRWWLYAWLIAQPLIVLIMFLVPLVIDPLFNNFQPLQARQPRLVEALEKVVHAGGLEIPRERMYEMDASRKVTTINAYVTGIGASKRVVVWDTAIQKLSQEETLFVFGHEMGHYVLNHIYKGLVVAAVLSFFGLYLFYRIALCMLGRFQLRWHLRGIDDWAALPMLFLIFGVLQFLGHPLASASSRYMEHQADIYGLEVTHDINDHPAQTAARAFQKLGEDGYSYPAPHPWLVFWYYSHPTIAERVKFAGEYDPWGKGQKPEFVKRF